MTEKQLIPISVLAQYRIGTVQKISVVKNGLIHQTFEIQTDQDKYIMQRLHPVLATEEIAQDFLMVTKFLHEQNFLTPVCVLTKKGNVLAKDKGRSWRLQTKLSGQTFDQLENVAMAAEAGRIYAKFHRVISGMTHEFHSTKILHDSEQIYKKFLQIIKVFEGRVETEVVRDEIDLIKTQFPKVFLPTNLPLRVIHGDPKISNILFVQKKAHAIIDLDTCNRRSILVEFGDAFRSWCGKKEDDPKNSFSLSLFRASWNEYKKASNGLLTKREIKLVPRAIELITLELAARFLTDYFEDQYFGWDEKRFASRRDHNLARCKGQLSLYKDVRKKQTQIEKIIQT